MPATAATSKRSAWYHAQVGELYLKLNKPVDAMRECATASQAFPGHPFAVVGYAKALEMMGKPSEARALFEDLVRKSPTPDVHARLGDLLQAEERAKDAEREYGRSRKPPGGSTRRNRRIWLAFSPTAAKRWMKLW